MNRSLEKFQDRFPVGSTVMYSNCGRRGDGNLAKVSAYLHRTGEPERVAAIHLTFTTGGTHFVTPNQLQKYYHKISA
jgi:hypothetical protein